MKQILNRPKLLPRKFKIIGYGLVVISIILFFLDVFKVIIYDREIRSTIDGSILLFGFLLIALTRDKIEDELTLYIRLQAFATAFMTGALLTIFEPYLNLLLIGEFHSNKGLIGTFIFMFLFYFFVKYQLKKDI